MQTVRRALNRKLLALRIKCLSSSIYLENSHVTKVVLLDNLPSDSEHIDPKMASIHSLPNELLHRIIGTIQAERREAFVQRDSDLFSQYTQILFPISYVSKNFHSIVNVYIYKTVILDSANLSWFVRTVLSSVELRLLVQEVSFEFDTEDYAKSAVDFRPLSNASQNEPQESPGENVCEHAPKVFNILSIPRQSSQSFSVENPDSLVIPADMYNIFIDKRNKRERESERQAENLTFHQEETALLLFILSSLRHLRINTPEEEDVVAGENGAEEGLFRCRFLRATLDLVLSSTPENVNSYLPSSFRDLQEFTFCDPYPEPGRIKTTVPPVQFWPLHWLACIFGLPRMRKITFVRARDPDPTSSAASPSDFLRRMKPRTLPLESLTLLSARLHTSVLGQLLQTPRALKSFTYEVADAFSLVDSDESYLKPVFISPRLILSQLEPQRETLESLSIRSVQSNSMATLDYACSMTPTDEDNYHHHGNGDDDEVSDSSNPATEDETEIETETETENPDVTSQDQDPSESFLSHAPHLLLLLRGPISLSSFPHLHHLSLHITDLLGIPSFPPSSSSRHKRRQHQRREPRRRPRLSTLLPHSLTSLVLRYDPLVPDGTSRADFSEPFTHLFELFADEAERKRERRGRGLRALEMNLRKMWYEGDFGVLDRLVVEGRAVGIEVRRAWHEDAEYDPPISGARARW